MTEFMSASRFPLQRLAYIAEIQLGKMLQTAPVSRSDVEVPYMRAGHLGELPDELPTMWASPLDLSRYRVDVGDLLVAEGGDIGRPEFVPKTAAGALIQNSLHRVRPRGEGDRRYLRYALLAVHGSDWLDVLCNRSTFGHLTVEKLSSLRVPVPSPRQQKAIADFLDTETARIDSLITKKRRMVGLLEEARDRELDRKALQRLSPRKRRDPADLPLEDEVPEGWSSVQMGHLLQRITYGFTNPMPTVEEGPYMLTANDVGDGEILFETARRTTSEAFDVLLTEKSRPRANDVLLTKDGSLGRVAMCNGERMCVNQSVAVLTPARHHVDPLLLMELLRVPAYRDALVFNAGGTTIKHLYISRVVKQRVALPPRGEQPKLAARLAHIHDLHRRRTTALQQSVALLQEHRQALITAAVTGELEVPGVAV